MPIIHRGEELGTLHIASRSPGETFTLEDSKFLDVLLRQAGPIVENVNMTLGMKLLAQDLQESREKLVLAREEERRQIRKNLHDDLAPRLAALALNAATAQKYVVKQPDTAIEMLADLRQVIRSRWMKSVPWSMTCVRPRWMSWDLSGRSRSGSPCYTKPAMLLADEAGATPLSVELHAPQPLPSLPAAVEVAVYRIVTESLVNVIKHAKASPVPSGWTSHLPTSCGWKSWIMAHLSPLGSGISGSKGGIGLVSIRERAAELGGHCTIERLENGGTRVIGCAPAVRV